MQKVRKRERKWNVPLTESEEASKILAVQYRTIQRGDSVQYSWQAQRESGNWTGWNTISTEAIPAAKQRIQQGVELTGALTKRAEPMTGAFTRLAKQDPAKLSQSKLKELIRQSEDKDKDFFLGEERNIKGQKTTVGKIFYQ